MLSDELYNKCFEFLRKEEVKHEIKLFMKPFIDMIIQELYPYIYLSLLFVIISFLLILAIFMLLWKKRDFQNKI
tara:strand:+ start:4845 stop:5066 length:222 start_codon:yes stop_codon:yes gene_type:complete